MSWKTKISDSSGVNTIYVSRWNITFSLRFHYPCVTFFVVATLILFLQLLPCFICLTGLITGSFRTLIHDIDLDIQSDTVRSTFGPLQTSVSVRRNKYQFKIHPTCQLFCVLHIRSKTDHQANAPPHIAMDLCTGIFYIITYSTYKKISEIQSMKKTWLGFRFIMHLIIFSASVP